jgi:hypothetical protein
VPGVAGGVAITQDGYRPEGVVTGATTFLRLPWLLLAAVLVLLPLLAASVAAVTARGGGTPATGASRRSA